MLKRFKSAIPAEIRLEIGFCLGGITIAFIAMLMDYVVRPWLSGCH